MVCLPRGRHPASHSCGGVYSYHTRYAIRCFYPSAPNAHLPQVHALYDRKRYITLTLIVMFLVENIVMITTLVKVVPGVGFDVSCTVIHSPSSLIFFAYDDVFLVLLGDYLLYK
jgi:hypothetical protein